MLGGDWQPMWMCGGMHVYECVYVCVCVCVGGGGGGGCRYVCRGIYVLEMYDVCVRKSSVPCVLQLQCNAMPVYYTLLEMLLSVSH